MRGDREGSPHAKREGNWSKPVILKGKLRGETVVLYGIHRPPGFFYFLFTSSGHKLGVESRFGSFGVDLFGLGSEEEGSERGLRTYFFCYQQQLQ